MRIKDVDFPKPLLAAQVAGRLVVFAGAGVSMSPPANFPSFKKLAEAIGSGASPKMDDEPDDRYLGRLEKEGVHVHEIAREILTNPASKPTALHYDLPRLFAKASDVRLVTTNFDAHFTTAAREVYNKGDQGLDIFCAPALPLGGAFNGIVYLHGSVTREPRSLVLTDSDFGRAYLTEGWARRFLQAMFAKYTVLFIGYSHNETVMNYLARGLPPDLPDLGRYALTPKGPTEHWRSLGVVPVPYPMKAEPNDHSALGNAVSVWATRARRGALDEEKEIKDIGGGPPPLDPEADDYMANMLEQIHTLRFFTRHASTPEWLRWAEIKGAFKALFEPGRAKDEIAQGIAGWFAEKFVLQHPEDALDVVQRLRTRLNATLWFAVVQVLYRPTNDVDPAILAKWVSVLLESGVPDGGWQFMDWIFSSLRHPEDIFTSIMLFEELARPHLQLEPSFPSLSQDPSQTRTDVRVSVHGEPYWLKQKWESCFKPNLAQIALALEPILTAHLQRAHYMLRAVGEANEHFDHVTFARAAIEPHAQNKLEHKTDILIDATRDTLEWMLENSPDHARTVIEAWSKSDVPLLRRLAIHGVIKNSHVGADEKLDWLLTRDCLYAPGLKHEVLQLLRAAYPSASEKTRIEVLQRVERRDQGGVGQRLSAEESDYEIFNLLHWLNQADPACPLVAERLTEIQTKNPRFRPREYPDLDVWYGDMRPGTSSPLTPDQLLEKKPSDILDTLLTYKGDPFEGPSREGLLFTVETAVAKSFEWGIQLAERLAEREEWQPDLWPHVLDGLRQHACEEQRCDHVLTLLGRKTVLHALAPRIADFLNSVMGEQGGGLPELCLPLAESISDEVWNVIDAPGEEEPIVQVDWLFTAINHPAGKITEFWLLALWRRHAAEEAGWHGIPCDFLARFERVLNGKTIAAQLGRVTIARQMDFFFSLDPTWTREHVFPILDWSLDEKRAEQAWTGFLSKPRLSQHAADDMIPLFQKTFQLMVKLPEKGQEAFCCVVADLAVFVLDNPIEQGWWRDFFFHAGSQERAWLAHRIGYILRDLTDEQKIELWNRWLGKYWTQRTQGVPRQLRGDEEETGHMLEWSLHLGPVLPEVVEQIRKGPIHSPRLGSFYHKLLDTDLAKKHPAAVASLLQYLLLTPNQSPLLCRIIDGLVRGLVAAGAPRKNLLLICESLAEIGCPTASELRTLIESTPGDSGNAASGNSPAP
jgi:hypothetical protein